MINLDKPLSYFTLSAKRDLCWVFKETNGSAPAIEFDIDMDEFTSSTFEFVLWGNKHPEGVPKKPISSMLPDSDESLEIYEDHKLIGHSFISMNRFCSSDVSVLCEVEHMLIQEVRFEDRLQKHGVVIG